MLVGQAGVALGRGRAAVFARERTVGPAREREAPRVGRVEGDVVKRLRGGQRGETLPDEPAVAGDEHAVDLSRGHPELRVVRRLLDIGDGFLRREHTAPRLRAVFGEENSRLAAGEDAARPRAVDLDRLRVFPARRQAGFAPHPRGAPVGRDSDAVGQREVKPVGRGRIDAHVFRLGHVPAVADAPRGAAVGRDEDAVDADRVADAAVAGIDRRVQDKREVDPEMLQLAVGAAPVEPALGHQLGADDVVFADGRADIQVMHRRSSKPGRPRDQQGKHPAKTLAPGKTHGAKKPGSGVAAGGELRRFGRHSP